MKQTITSKYEPKSKNVTWIDMSSGSPVQKNFINGMWIPTGGGGGSDSGSLPQMTNDDIGKVLTVGKEPSGKTQTATIIPEQVPNNNGKFTNCNTQYFKEGTLVKLYVDGELKYEGPIIKDGADLAVEAENGGEDIFVCLSDNTLWSDSAEKYAQSTFFMTTEIPQMQPKAVWSNSLNNNGLIIPSFTYEDLGYNTQWYAKINKLDLSSPQAPETNVFLIPIDLISGGGYKRYTICVIDKVQEWPSSGNQIGAVIGYDRRYYNDGGVCDVYYKQDDNEYVYLNAYMEGDWG